MRPSETMREKEQQREASEESERKKKRCFCRPCNKLRSVELIGRGELREKPGSNKDRSGDVRV